MHLSKLFGVIGIVQLFIAELFTGKVEYNISHNVIAVIIPLGAKHTIDLSTEDVLCQKSGNGALSESDIILAPLPAKTGSAGVFAPYLGKSVIELTWIANTVEIVVYRRD